jgi:hypothetical protein
MKKIIVFLLLAFSAVASAQVRMGDKVPTTANESTSSYLLDINSDTKALVVTRVAATSAITTPVNGMIVYITSENKFKIYQNNSWTNLFN